MPKNIGVWIGIAVVAGVLFLLKQKSLVGTKIVKDIMSEKEFMLIDVRTPQEYQGGNIKGAVNLPLDNITRDISQTASDKSQKLLLYCRSGARSGMAVRLLKKQGYTNVFNLGSFSRAAKLIEL